MPNANAATHALDYIAGQPWLITEEALSQIVAIAGRINDSPEAVATRLGRPLENARTVQTYGQTAVIPITGPIVRYANLFSEISGATSLEVLARDFQTALDSNAIEHIILNLDSPGGQSSGIAEFARLVKDSPKPVTAYVGDIAASAAYWIASQASSIVASPTAMVGSIGVVMTWRASKDQPLEIVSTQSPLKRADPTTDAGRLEAQRLVDQLATIFVADVAVGRGVHVDTVLADFGRGSLLIGEHAIAAGMIDRIASLTSLISAGAPGPTHRRGIVMTNPVAGAPTIDRAYLETKHPDLLASLSKEFKTIGYEDGLLAGASTERSRIQSVREQLIPGHEALIERLAFDGKTSGEQAAVQVLAAERQQRTAYQEAVANASPPPVPAALAPVAEAPEDFETKVAALIAAGQSRAQAIRATAAAHPEQHAAYLARVNRA